MLNNCNSLVANGLGTCCLLLVRAGLLFVIFGLSFIRGVVTLFPTLDKPLTFRGWLAFADGMEPFIPAGRK